MFKIDEIQKQSRESLKLIDDTYSEVRKKSDNLDETMGGAMKRIEGAIEQKIEEFSQSIKRQSSELETKINDYKQTVSAGADNNQKLFTAFSTLIESMRNSQSATAQDKSPTNNK